MIKKSSIKKLAEQHNKKIGKLALEKIDFLVEEFIKKLLKKAIRRADISGRIILKEEDFNN